MSNYTQPTYQQFLSRVGAKPPFKDCCAEATWMNFDELQPIRYAPDLSIWDRVILGSDNMRKEETKTETKEQKIYLDRSDSYDRAIISGDRLEPTDVFRIVDDAFRKIYMVIDTSDVIDETSVDESVIYALDIATAKVVAMDKDIKVYVYNSDGVKFHTGDFVKDYGKKEIDV